MDKQELIAQLLLRGFEKSLAPDDTYNMAIESPLAHFRNYLSVHFETGVIVVRASAIFHGSKEKRNHHCHSYDQAYDVIRTGIVELTTELEVRERQILARISRRGAYD